MQSPILSLAPSLTQSAPILAISPSLLARKRSLGSLLDKILHPTREPEAHDDPSRPFTPPPSKPSKQEKDDDDDDGPRFPMDPALA